MLKLPLPYLFLLLGLFVLFVVLLQILTGTAAFPFWETYPLRSYCFLDPEFFSVSGLGSCR